jgi:hypothetical protein
MSSIKWGPPTWILMHTLIETIKKKNVNFNNIKIQLFNIIKNICLFSSCPVAWHNSRSFFDKADPNTLNNINDFKNFLYIFHNFINAKKNAPLFNYNNMNVYENYNITTAYNNFVNVYVNNNIQINIKMKQTIKELNNFIIFLSQIEYKKKEIKIVENVTVKKEENVTVKKEENVTVKKEENVTVEKEENVTVEKEENVTVEKENITFKVEEIVTVEVDVEEKEENVVVFINNEIKTVEENLDKIEDDNIFPEGLSFLDDKLLPAFDLNFSQALLEISKNPKCVPFDIYIERWKHFNKKHIEKQNRKNKNNKNNNITNTIIDESLLPSFNLSLPVAMTKIQNNPLCVPSDLYIKKWNEIKSLAKYRKNVKNL